MFTLLQLAHWLPKEYIEGPVPFVHLMNEPIASLHTHTLRKQ